jgi:hypothetical protein
MRDTAQLGPSQEHPSMWAPRTATPATSESDIPAEAAAIVRVVLQEGAIARSELSQRVRSSLREPARFQRALRYALAHGMICHVTHGVYTTPRHSDRIAITTAHGPTALAAAGLRARH